MPFCEARFDTSFRARPQAIATVENLPVKEHNRVQESLFLDVVGEGFQLDFAHQRKEIGGGMPVRGLAVLLPVHCPAYNRAMTGREVTEATEE